MDDLLLIFFYAEHDGILRDMLTEDVKMITDTSRENPIYHKDLNIKPETDPRGAPCLGTLITTCTDPDTGSQTLNIRYLNKNEITIQQPEPFQTTLRLQHRSSFAHISQKMGTIVGEITRIRRLTLHDDETRRQIRILRKELIFLGYDDRHLKQAISKKYKKTGDIFWRDFKQFTTHPYPTMTMA